MKTPLLSLSRQAQTRSVGRRKKPFLVFLVGLFVLLLSLGQLQAVNTGWTLVGWNNLGMHCMDSDYSVFSILPPYNTIDAQLMDATGVLVKSSAGVSVTYQAIADPSGSINKSSVGKSSFWLYSLPLFGVSLANDVGLAGFAMPGASNIPQSMLFNGGLNWFDATGVPITPYDDASHKNTYPMMHLVARDASNNILAQTDIVLPVSDELDCRVCHASGSGPAAMPVAGWVNNPNPEIDYRLNILLLHDEKNLSNPTFTGALAANGFNAGGLYPNVVTDHKPVLCAVCHASAALGTTGYAGTPSLTSSMHAFHGHVVDPTNGMTLDQTANRSACYRCHPGSTTRCLRGAMGSAVASDGSMEMQCQSCHGSMTNVGVATRQGWLEEPNCQSCHTGTATSNSGQIRFTSAFDSPGHYRVPVDTTFATNPNTPAAGISLYRFSKGHGGLQCEACHGSTHAEFPSSHGNDNIQSMQLQGHVGMLVECTTCHNATPATVTGGPHGMHPVGHDWVSSHGEAAGEGGSAVGCQLCHGADLKGTVLSRAQGDRSFSTSFGTVNFWRGFQISCYACHNGLNTDAVTPNHPPVVTNTTASPPMNTPVQIGLQASDPDGNPLTLRVVSQPAHGTAGLIGTTATYFPETGYVGPDSFTFAAWDGFTNSNLGTVSIDVATAACTYTLSTHMQTFSAAGGSSSVNVTAANGCDWTAGTTDSWIMIQSGMAGSGNGVVNYSVSANTSTSSRSGSLTIAGQVVTVQQAVASGADLSGGWSSLTQTCKNSRGTPKCTLKGTLAVQNTGTVTANNVSVAFYLSDTSAYHPGSGLLLKTMTVGSVRPSTAKSVKLIDNLPTGTSASGKYVIAVIDPNNVIPETNKSNNIVVFGPVP